MQPWFAQPAATLNRTDRIAILGAGLAGCACAHALAIRGYSCRLFDSRAGIAHATSAVPCAVVKPHISRSASIASGYFQRAFDFLLTELERLHHHSATNLFNPLGVLQLVEDYRAWPSSAGAIDRSEASMLAGTNTPAGALFLDCAGWLNPAELCRRWIAESALIQFTGSAAINALRNHQGKWQLIGAGSEVLESADGVVIASGTAVNQLAQAAALPLQISLGQLSSFGVAARLPLRRVITGRGLVIPQAERIWLGSTHQICTTDTPVTTTAAARQTNLVRLGSLCELDPTAWQHGTDWAGLRASTTDRLPLVGGLPHREYYLHEYREIRHGRNPAQYAPAGYHDGLYVLGGLGSRGATQAAFAGELLAGLITGIALSDTDQRFLDAIHPGRFFIRALRRGQSIPKQANDHAN